MRIRGQLAACSGNNNLYVDVPSANHRDACGFKYGPMATPVVTHISPDQAVSDDPIVIHGSGFSEVPSENYVVFGDVECAVMSSTSTTIECTLSSGFAGFRRLYLHVLYSGVAEVRGTLGTTYSLTVSSVDPARGSGAGGTVVIVTGSGFYHTQPGRDRPISQLEGEGLYPNGGTTFECPNNWRNEVLVGGTLCTVIDSTSTTLTVTVPAEASGSFSTYDLEVSIVCPDRLNISQSTTLSDAYTYDASLTPVVLSVSPNSSSIQGGQTVTISGDGFASSTSDNQVLVRDDYSHMYAGASQLRGFSLLVW